MTFRDLDAATGTDRPLAAYSPCPRWHAAAELGLVTYKRGVAMYRRADEALPYHRLLAMPMAEKFWYSGGFHAVS